MTDPSRRGCPFAFTAPGPSSGAPSLPRRRLLLGLGAGAAGGALGFAASPGAATASAAPMGEPAEDRQPFYGPRQSGVVTPQPAAGTIVAFDVLANSREDLRRLLTTLTARIAFLMAGGRAETADPLMPPPESGLLGPVIRPDGLTVTVAVGASLFDERFGLASQRPVHLKPMQHFPNDELVDGMTHGDLLLQFCANTAETNIHALRDILKHCPDLLAMRWTIDGFLPPRTVRALGRETVRNLLGFKDGTANLDASDGPLMDRVVWTAGAGEPAWTANGTYQVVRIIRCLVERWDRTPLGEQQTIIGRDKASGAPLGLSHERDLPDYAADPEGLHVPLNAHIRLANPRTADSQANLILRRPFNYAQGLTKAGQLDMGLLFVCFQADLAAGFETVQGRLNGEPLEEYIRPVGGGYFFVLPGVAGEGGYFGEELLSHAA